MAKPSLASSLRLKIILILVGVLASIIGVFSYLQFRYYERYFYTTLQNNSLELSEIIVSALELGMVSKQSAQVNSILKNIAESRNVEQVMILSKEGKVSFSSAEDETPFSPGDTGEMCIQCHGAPGNAPLGTASLIIEKDGGQIFRNIITIHNKPECYSCHREDKTVNGFLVLDYSAGEISEILSVNKAQMRLFTFFIVIATIVCLSYFLYRLVTKKLSHVTEVAEAISLGNLNARISLPGRDEFSRLALAFNSMTAELENSLEKSRNSYQYLTTIIDSIEDSIVVVDRDLKIKRANGAFTKRARLEGIPVLGICCFEVLKKSDDTGGQCERCPARRCFAQGAVTKSIRTEIDNEGKERCYEVHCSPVKNRNGDVEEVIEVSRDITERRSLEAQLIHSEKLTSLGRLAAGIAHEINNPMSSITACTDGIKRALKVVDLSRFPELSDLDEYLDIIRNSAFRAKSITGKLLQCSRKTDLSLEPVDVNEIANDAMTLMELESREKKIVITGELQADVPLIFCDRGEITQVLLNILLNAIDSIESNGMICVSTEFSENAVLVRIQDSGCGIDSEGLKNIFEPFYTTKPVGAGTGLGLAICDAIMKNHGGKIMVESRKGEGTAFTIIFNEICRDLEKCIQSEC